MTTTLSPRAQLEKAFVLYQKGDLAGAESALAPIADNPSAVHLMGLVRVRQGRVPEAADILGRAVGAQPQEAQAHFNHGKVLAMLGRYPEAAAAFGEAVALEPRHSDALFGQGKALQAMGDRAGAIAAFRNCIAAKPAHLPARLLLGAALLATGQAGEAKIVFAGALAASADPGILAEVHQGLAAANQAQGNEEAALDHLDRALGCDPDRVGLELERGRIFEKLGRYDQAQQAYRKVLERDPIHGPAHRALSDLKYRLGEETFLRSYELAPRTKELTLDRAQMLLAAERLEEAEGAFRLLLSRYGDDKQAFSGLGVCLAKMGRLPEAASILEHALQAYPDSVDLCCNLSAALARLGDPEKGAVMAAKAVALEPHNQLALAMQGTCWRLMGDHRDDVLNGYEKFIQVFDLKAPDGYRDIRAFNAELSAALADLHPATREYLGQSLRGGTQTSNDLFADRHPLVERLRERIEDAVLQYISSISAGADHPLVTRRAEGYAFSGSWSSQLRSGGFHINHLHPGGWISSCYYVDVPAAVRDERECKGWIKFGQPSFDVGLEPVRAIQPVPGRLVLFPSYMWHGTIPFEDNSVRTTIAFDVVPAGHG